MQGKWQHDQIIQVVRNEAYSGPVKPQIAGIDFRIYQTLPTQYQDLLADQLDIVPQIPTESLASARADLGDRFKAEHGLDHPDPRLPHLRQALLEGRHPQGHLDGHRSRRDRAHHLLGRAGFPARLRAAVPAGSRPNTCGEACEYNPQKAKALFDSAGGAAAVGGRIEFAYNVDGGHKPWIDAACNQIRRNLGVECLGNPQPKFADLLRKAKAKESMGLFRMGWIADYPVLENYLEPLYSTNGVSNYYGYSNPEVDKLLAAGDRAPTQAAALEQYQKAEDIIAHDLPVLPLRYMQNTFGVLHARGQRGTRSVSPRALAESNRRHALMPAFLLRRLLQGILTSSAPPSSSTR